MIIFLKFNLIKFLSKDICQDKKDKNLRKKEKKKKKD